MNLAPLPIQKFFGNDGRPLNGGLLFTYVAGTTTKVATYTDSTGGTPNTNPVVLNFRGEANIWLDPLLTYKFVLSPANDTDPPTNPIWTVDNITAALGITNLTQQFLGQILFPRTLAEIAAAVVPTNYWVPSHEATGKFDLRRYGAAETFNNSINDLPFFNTAISVAGTNGGVLTGPARKYRINGTLDLTTLIDFDFGTSNDGGATLGTILFSDTNANVMRFNGGARFVNLGGISIVGTTGAGLTAQNGIVVNNSGIRLSNFVIRACGNDGLQITQSYAGSYRDGYISLCARDGVRVNGGCGGNIWDSITSAGNAGDGFNILAADGGDVMIACDAEANTGAGLRFGSGVIGWQIRGHHSETNTGGSCVFEAGSNRNKVNFRTWGDSGGVDLDPVNNGGTDNTWTGLKFASGGGGFNSGYIEPKLIQRVEMETSAVSSSAAFNATPYDDTKPQSNEGGNLGLSLTITPKRAGNIIVIRAWGVHSGHTAGVMIATLFKDSETDARDVNFHQNAIDDATPFLLEYQFTTTSLTATTWSVNHGNNNAGTITINGINTARKFGGITISGMSIEEFWPMS